ncbi:MAG: hypothetical protein RLZ75_1217, partial [Pseudomonadota bacterium]
KTNRGVIKEPPPTPVTPTNNPTAKPENVYPKFIKANLMFYLIKNLDTITANQHDFEKLLTI